MQDAFEDLVSAPISSPAPVSTFAYDFGVLAEWSRAKGGELLAEALKRMPGRKCLWIGNPPKDGTLRDGIEFAGRMPQDEAFGRLRRCRILVAPYLATRAFKWNYPLKLFEYLRLGRPILASDNPGNVAVAKRYDGRITLFKSGDVAAFVEKASEVNE
ncbi:MAG: glycosyltransferase [Kiritimatiellia bacterium]